MGLRPARTVRTIKGQAWARISQRKPRRSYIKGAPHPKTRQYDMGTLKVYDVQLELVSQVPINMRDNALEAARMTANKYLELNIPGNYYLKLNKYPHHVIREKTALGVAGSDRISKGMKLAFGKPRGRMAPIHVGERVFTLRTYAPNVAVAKHALKKAGLKMSGDFKITVRPLTAQEKAVSVVKEFKKIVVETTPAVAKDAAAPAAGAEGAPAAAAPAADAKADDKAKGKK